MSGSTVQSPAAASPIDGPDVKPGVIRRPSIIMKPAQTPPAGSPPPQRPGTLSLTSKEWVIPPRPKPGRKPATDTPPSKRKAQNRAAQRAFRERRAARVNELEDQIKQTEDDHDKECDDLRVHVTVLEAQVAQHRLDLEAWAERCRSLEAELQNFRSSRSSQSGIPADRLHGDTSVGCGKCTLDSRCQCIDEAFDAMAGEERPDTSSSGKRAHSPAAAGAEKRIKTEPHDSLEVDFTAMYARPPLFRPEHTSSSTVHVVVDPCGFCSDGTPCICAEMAAEQSRAASRPPPVVQTSSRRDLPRLSQFTPPPSDGDVSMTNGSVPPSAAAASNPCANGPGTCAQCRADPNSTLFCKSLAASRSQSATGLPSGCCGGSSSTGGCCQSQPPSTDAVPLPRRVTRHRRAAPRPTTADSINDINDPPRPSNVTLTCADAYTTLSRHPAYERASAEITSWMPKLHASDSVSPGPGKGAMEAHRPAMEIDAANVMAVLRDFDRRFGRNS